MNQTRKTRQWIGLFDSLVKEPGKDLPEDIFLFVTGITPIVNVDLLIRNSKKQILLTWRDDGFYEPGWHVPGGIIRYKEKMRDRVKAVAKGELGARVDFDPVPIAVNEVIHPSRRARGHFISLLFECRLKTELDKTMKYSARSPKPDQWAWHTVCPRNILSVHRMYKKYFKN